MAGYALDSYRRSTADWLETTPRGGGPSATRGNEQQLEAELRGLSARSPFEGSPSREAASFLARATESGIGFDALVERLAEAASTFRDPHSAVEIARLLGRDSRFGDIARQRLTRALVDRLSGRR